MEADTTLPLSHKRKSGSENRKRGRVITLRVSQPEYEAMDEAARAEGVTLGTHIRNGVLKSPQTGRRRRPQVDVAALAPVHAQLRHIGGNLNQIARALNIGELRETAALPDTIAQVQAALVELRRAMGFAE